MYLNKTMAQYLNELGDKKSAPGGGSAISYVGAMGIGLVQMAMAFALDKKEYSELDENLKISIEANLNRLGIIREKLEVNVDEDTKAFNQALEAFKLPKNTEEEKRVRADAIQEGYKKALSVPLEVFELSFEALNLLDILAENSNKALISDMGLGSKLIYAALEGSIINVLINLSHIKDEEYKEEIIKNIDKKLQIGLEKDIENQEFVDKTLRGNIGLN